MGLPVVEVKVTADTTQATANLNTFGKQLSAIPATGKKATAAASGFSGAMQRMGNVSNRARSQIQNTAFQLQDMAVQLEMGTSVSRTMSQQLPQLLGGFGAVGAAVGVLAAVGIPLLTAAFGDILDGAEDFDDVLSELQDTIKDLDGGLGLLATSADDLNEKYGAAADRVRELALSWAELAVSQAARRLDEHLGILDDVIEGYTRAAGEVMMFGQVMDGLGLPISNLMDDLGVTADQALVLVDAFTALDTATGFDEQQAALQGILDILKLQDVALSKLPPDLQDAIAVMITFSNETDRARVLMDQLSASAAGVTIGVPLFEQDLGDQGLLPPAADPEKPSTRRGGGGREASRLEALIKSLQTEQETIDQWRVDGLERLASASEAELEVLGGINEAKLRLEQEYQDRLRGIKIKAQQTDLSMTLGAGADVLSALGAFNDKAFRMAKVASAAQALISTFEGAAEALKLPFPENFAAVAAVMAKGLGLVAAIKGVSSSGGGGGAGGGGAGAAAAAAPAQTPLNVRLSGLGAGDSITGGQLSSLFDRLQDESQDRGLRISFAT